MSCIKAIRLFRIPLLLALVLLLGACGFHLRGNANLPAGMQQVHLDAKGDSYFKRQLTRALEVSGATVVDGSGPGIAELRVPQARFSRESLTAGGYLRITEASVRYKVRFDVLDGDGAVLVPEQNIEMSREYSYDASNSVGNSAQVEALQHGLNADMVQAIMFRLQAVGQQVLAACIVRCHGRAGDQRARNDYQLLCGERQVACWLVEIDGKASDDGQNCLCRLFTSGFADFTVKKAIVAQKDILHHGAMRCDQHFLKHRRKAERLHIGRRAGADRRAVQDDASGGG